LDEVNASAAGVTISYDKHTDRFTIVSNRKDYDEMLFREEGRIPFFSTIKIPTGIQIIGGDNNKVINQEGELPGVKYGWLESTGLGNTGKDIFRINIEANSVRDYKFGVNKKFSQYTLWSLDATGASPDVTTFSLPWHDVDKDSIVLFSDDNGSIFSYDPSLTTDYTWTFDDNRGAAGSDVIRVRGAGLNISINFSRLNAYDFPTNDIDPDTLIVKIDGQEISREYWRFVRGGGENNVDRIVFERYPFFPRNITVDYRRIQPLAVDVFIPNGNEKPEDIKFSPNISLSVYTSGAVANFALKNYHEEKNITLLKHEQEYLYNQLEDLYDANGVRHLSKFIYEKLADNEWLWYALNPVLKDEVAGYGIMRFKGGGAYGKEDSVIFESPSDPAEIGKRFRGIYFNVSGVKEHNGDVRVSLDFSDLLQYSGAENNARIVAQDGYATGRLLNYNLDSLGYIVGQYSNGRAQNLARIGIATFTNPEGLSREKAAMFSETISSGKVNIGTPGSNAKGKIVSGTLELSNVKLEEEFVNMIIAQRGYKLTQGVL